MFFIAIIYTLSLFFSCLPFSLVYYPSFTALHAPHYICVSWMHCHFLAHTSTLSYALLLCLRWFDSLVYFFFSCVSFSLFCIFFLCLAFPVSFLMLHAFSLLHNFTISCFQISFCSCFLCFVIFFLFLHEPLLSLAIHISVLLLPFIHSLPFSPTLFSLSSLIYFHFIFIFSHYPPHLLSLCLTFHLYNLFPGIILSLSFPYFPEALCFLLS